jgi:transposase
MSSIPRQALPTLDEAAGFSPEQVVELALDRATLERDVGQLQQKIAGLEHQVDWFRRQIFGQKSEKRSVLAPAEQMSLGELLSLPQTGTPPDAPERSVAAHSRKRSPKAPDAKAESISFFDEARVPIEVIALASPDIAGLTPEQYEIIGTKESFRLAQRPGSYVVIKYVRPIVKRVDTQLISCPAAPVGVIEGSRADVSFVAGLLLDKMAYHLPFHRVHQRLTDAGFKVSRPWLTQLGQQASSLLEPVYDAMLASIRASRVIAMDETPIKAGQNGPGKMKQGYFWPVYGELDEVCFPFFDNRRADSVFKTLGMTPAQGAVLLSDGYSAYAHYAKKTGLTHAQCWAHARREVFEAKDAEPSAVAEGLDHIGAIYCHRSRHPRQEADRREETRLSPDTRETAGGTLLCLGLTPIRKPGPLAKQSADQGTCLHPKSTKRARSLPHRSGCPHRHQPPRACAQGDSNGSPCVDVLPGPSSAPSISASSRA